MPWIQNLDPSLSVSFYKTHAATEILVNILFVVSSSLSLLSTKWERVVETSALTSIRLYVRVRRRVNSVLLTLIGNVLWVWDGEAFGVE